MKAIIHNSIQEAQAFNHQEALDRGCSGATTYWYQMKQLTQTTTLTKVQYAELNNIPATIVNEEQETVANPEYTALNNSYTVSKYGVVVEDSKDVTDEDGNVTVPDNVVDITDLLPVASDEI